MKMQEGTLGFFIASDAKEVKRYVNEWHKNILIEVHAADFSCSVVLAHKFIQ